MRIGSGLGGVDLTVQHQLQQINAAWQQSATRLSTMTRLNRGADDPAALIAAEAIEAELASLEALDSAGTRAAGAVHVADSALASVGELLTSIQGHIVEAAGAMTDEERGAHQIEIDAAVQAIDRIGGSTGFAGRPLLSGGELTLQTSSDLTNPATLALASVSSGSLGGDAGRLMDLVSGGSASLQSGNFKTAMAIVGQARSSVLQSRAGAGAFERSSIEAMQRVRDSMVENLSSALGEIRDTDVAAETSLMVRAEILGDAALSSLQWIGQRRSGVLSLLSGGGFY